MASGDDKSDPEVERLRSSTKLLLESVDQRFVQRFSISVVPEQLRRGNENAYIPKAVSMGPRYKGRRDLLPMEEVKLRCMLSLLDRAQHPLISNKDLTKGLAKDRLERCMKVLLELDGVVRASYVEEIKLERHELATIMLHDGCFLLELLISADKELNQQLGKFYANPGAEVSEIEDVMLDLTLLENQIPLIIPHKLFQNLFIECESATSAKIESMALSLFGYPRYSASTLNFNNVAHILDLVHLSFIKDSGKAEAEENTQHVSIDIAVDNSSTPTTKRKEVELNRCATRLLACGIRIRTERIDFYNNPPNKFKSFQFGIRFDNSTGLLEIPQLHISQRTETEWRNFIAWEHHGKNCTNSSTAGENHEKEGNDSSSEDEKHLIKACSNSSIAGIERRCCLFTSLAIFFSDLICCESDVQLLKDKKIIVVYDSLKKKMSNQDLQALFRSVTSGVNRRIIDSSYSKMFDELNKYSATNCATRFPILFWHSFTRIVEAIYDLQKFLRRGYNFAAAIITLLTVIQTIYTVLSYHFPK